MITFKHSCHLTPVDRSPLGAWYRIATMNPLLWMCVITFVDFLFSRSLLCAKLTARVKDRPNAFNYNNGRVTRLSLFIWDHSPRLLSNLIENRLYMGCDEALPFGTDTLGVLG